MAKISSITLPNGDSYDLKDKDAQRKITVSGILKGDGQGGVSAATAGDVPYDNADSGLTAEDVQEAIDELAAGAGGGGVDPETIAPVEETATATIVHPLGSIFYFNDILYRAIEDIPVGGTINTATGGNATQTTIAQNFKRTVTLTSAEYAQLSIAEKTADIVYIITDDNSIRANDVNYDHETSGASTTNVQDALDEVFSELGGKQPTITASGILKGDGAGGVTAATAGTDYQAPLTIDATPTANSTNPVQSGGVYTDVRTRVPVYGLGKNLLDNWYFLNAVNQRNLFTVIATNSNVYTLDRWNAYRVILAYGAGSPLVFYASNSGVPTGYVHQWIEKDIVGKQVTASALLQDGTLLTVSGLLSEDTTLTSNNVSNVEIWVRKISGSNAEFFIWSRALNAQAKVVAVKLELGTEQTLVHQEGSTWVLNEIPDYEYELIRCKTSTADPTDIYANKVISTNISNPNLLRNWYFVGGGTGPGVFPVNQRGQSSYDGFVYSIDNWQLENRYGQAITINSDGIQIIGTSSAYQGIQQYIDPSLFNGQKVTISALCTDGTLATASGIITITSSDHLILNSGGDLSVFLYGSTSLLGFHIRCLVGITKTIVAAKLELGTEQTLCHNEGTAEAPVWVLNEVPDYEYELYRCITSTADPSDTYANKTLATGEELAYVENGTTASRNYSAGQYISLNGLLYTADTAIASGATFYTSGGNKNLTECVGGGFNSLSKVTNANVTFSSNVTGYTYQNEYHLSKSGNVVVANIVMSVSSIAGMGTVLCTVPEAFRPSVRRRIAAWLTYNNESKVETVMISPAGEISTASGGYSVSGFIRVFGTYIL